MPPKKKASSAPEPVEPVPVAQAVPSSQNQDTDMKDAPSPGNPFGDLDGAKSGEVVTMKGGGRIQVVGLLVLLYFRCRVWNWKLRG